MDNDVTVASQKVLKKNIQKMVGDAIVTSILFASSFFFYEELQRVT